jgi:WD40 repeat protein
VPGLVHVWDVASKAELHRFQIDARGYEYGLYFSPDAKALLARSEQAKVTMWRLDTEATATLDGHGFEGNSLTFLADGRRFVTTSLRGLVKLCDLETGTELGRFANGIGGCSDTVLSPGGQRLLLAGFHGLIQFWDLQSGRQTAALRAFPDRQFVCKIGFLDENTLVSLFENELRYWRAPSWAEINSASQQ